MGYKKALLIFLTCLLTCAAYAQDLTEKKEPWVELNATCTGDILTNFSGGIKRGTEYLGLVNVKISLNTRNIGLWKGGEFFINGANAHGGDPSSELIGDYHIVDNIETEDLTYLHELWYKQSIGIFEITLGLQDLNAEFVSAEFGSAFINSTFGTPSTIANNVPSPIFPLTALGLVLNSNMGQNAIKVAVFDGIPTSFTDNPHNLRWKIDNEEGIFAIAEYSRSGKILSMEGLYKSGIYYHSPVSVDKADFITPGQPRYNYGIYVIADQVLWEDPDGKGNIGLFVQLAASPEKINMHNLYFGTGLTFNGLFPGRAEDSFGLAYNRTRVSDPAIKGESILEINYKATVCRNLFIQPDFQYVMNPAGTDYRLKNAFTGLLRFGLGF